MNRGVHFLKNMTLNTASTSVGSGAWVELDHTGVGQNAGAVCVFNSGTEIISLGYGLAGSEQVLCAIYPGSAVRQEILVPSGRLSVKSRGGTQSAGIISVDIFG